MTVVTLEEFLAQRHRATDLVVTAKRFTQTHHSLVVACADFADGPVWIADGAPSAAHWLAERTDHCANTLREWIRIGRSLRGLRATAAAFEAGELSFSKVRALTRFATAENEDELLELAGRVPAAGIATALAAWSARNEEDDVIEARQRRHRHLSTRIDPDGTVCGSFRLPPLAGGKLLAAVNTTMMRSTAKRQPDGTWPTESTVGRQLPDVFMRALIHDSNRRPVDATNRRRFPTPRQMRLVKARDKACVDCGRRDLLVYDHVPPFEASGHTLTAELELRCSPCHTKRHDQHDRSARSLVRRPGLEGAAPA